MSVACSVQLVENVLLFTLLNLLNSYFRYEYSQKYVAWYDLEIEIWKLKKLEKYCSIPDQKVFKYTLSI